MRAFLGTRPPNPGRPGPAPAGPAWLTEAAAQSSSQQGGNCNLLPARGRHLVRLRPQGQAAAPVSPLEIGSACALEPWWSSPDSLESAPELGQTLLGCRATQAPSLARG
ncbi:hypothetical protein P7K49_024309, partial [Saguinus oedipus]